jgi:hypothetical protein
MQEHGAGAGAVEAEQKSMQEHGAGAGAYKCRIKSICRSRSSADATMDEIYQRISHGGGEAHLRCPPFNSAFSRRPTRYTCCTREGPVHHAANFLLNRVKQYSYQ